MTASMGRAEAALLRASIVLCVVGVIAAMAVDASEVALEASEDAELDVAADISGDGSDGSTGTTGRTTRDPDADSDELGSDGSTAPTTIDAPRVPWLPGLDVEDDAELSSPPSTRLPTSSTGQPTSSTRESTSSTRESTTSTRETSSSPTTSTRSPATIGPSQPPTTNAPTTLPVTTVPPASPTTSPPAPAPTTTAPPAPTKSPQPPPTKLSSNIVDYTKLKGDQVVTVPNGRYAAGPVAAKHPATNGPYQGWLILVSETPRGAVIDLAAAPLELAAGSSRIMFVGFRFVNGTILHSGGTDIAYWYTDHTFPIEVWDAEFQRAGQNFDRMVHRTPTTIRLRGGDRISFYGSDFHDIGDDAFSGYSTSRLLLQGVRIWNVDDKGKDPGFGGPDGGDLIHNDAIGSTGGLDELTVRDSFLGQRIYLGAENGSVGKVRFQNVWSTKSKSAGFIFYVGRGNFITGSRSNVRSWGHEGRGNIDRLDIVEGTQVEPNSRPARINITEDGISRQAPPPGAPDPAQSWRASNPYAGWSGSAR